ncbi:MAG: hypothetical protein NXH85_05070 [Pseudomonadaceae bacterium]|nr:hypothetical protein [Pseudomonadaceae bacterium]
MNKTALKSRITLHTILVLALVALVVVIARTAQSADGREGAADASENSAPRGEYLTTLLGCAGCHTEGALEGRAYGPSLAGSRIGIAYTDAPDDGSPGIVFPANLTPDQKTGLGTWSRDDVAGAIRAGTAHNPSQKGERLSPVMPWANYSQLTIGDTYAIADYLLTLDPVRREIPESVEAGSANTLPYLRIGIYRFHPTKTDVNPEAD